MPFQPLRHVTSHQHAEDISLLLQSLGMEVHIDEPTPQAGWLIWVESARSYDEARRVLAEEEAAAQTPVAPVHTPGRSGDFAWVLGLVLINIAAWAIMEQHGGTHDRHTLLRFGAVYSPLLYAGEWWRLVTAQFIHIGVRHLFGNMAALLVLGGLTVRILGPGRLLFVYVVAGGCGNLAGFAFGSDTALRPGPRARFSDCWARWRAADCASYAVSRSRLVQPALSRGIFSLWFWPCTVLSAGSSTRIPIISPILAACWAACWPPPSRPLRKTRSEDTGGTRAVGRQRVRGGLAVGGGDRAACHILNGREEDQAMKYGLHLAGRGRLCATARRCVR